VGGSGNRARADRARHLAGHGDPAPPAHLEVRDRVQQHTGVRVLRMAEHLACGPGLDEPPKVHNSQIVGKVVDHGEVVTDEEVGQPEGRGGVVPAA
jgi:hypothetical protein